MAAGGSGTIQHGTVPYWVPLEEAQRTRVAFGRDVLSDKDVAQVLAVSRGVQSRENLLENNPQNSRHGHKTCWFLNRGRPSPLRSEAPNVLGRLLRFAQHAWKEEGWSDEGSVHPIRAS